MLLLTIYIATVSSMSTTKLVLAVLILWLATKAQ